VVLEKDGDQLDRFVKYEKVLRRVNEKWNMSYIH